MEMKLTWHALIWLPLFTLAAAALSMFFTFISIRLLPLFGLIDIPHGRHQHARPVPRGGGIAIILSFVLTGLLVYLLMSGVERESAERVFIQLGPPIAVMAVLGLLDDRFELDSWIKLLVQILVALYFYLTDAGIDSLLNHDLPMWIALPLTICWVVGITNAFNLIDGMDGVAAGLASIAAFSMAVWVVLTDGTMVVVAALMIFCGACLGFLRYNFSPAKIFMGDTGSLFIGMLFAYFSMAESVKAITLTSLLVPILAMGVPIFDVFLAILRRLFRKYVQKEPGVGIMTGDHDHLHHRINQQEQNQTKTARKLYSLGVLLSVGAICSALVSNLLQTLSFAILLLIIFIVVRFATIEFYDAVSLISEGIRFPHRKFLLTAFHPILDMILLTTAYLLVSVIFQRNILISPYTLRQALFYLAPFPVVLGLSGIYRTYWLRTGVVQFYKLLLALIFAAMIVLANALGFILIEFDGINRDQISLMREFYTAYVFMGFFFIFLERFLLHYIESYSFRRIAMITEKKRKLYRSVVYGGGLYCKMFLTSQYSVSQSPPTRQVVGVIDDNPSLRGLNVHGQNVLGTSRDLAALKEKYQFDEIVIALGSISDRMRKKLNKFGAENNVRVVEFTFRIGAPEQTEGTSDSEHGKQ